VLRRHPLALVVLAPAILAAPAAGAAKSPWRMGKPFYL
jgi:hypothetical protein